MISLSSPSLEILRFKYPSLEGMEKNKNEEKYHGERNVSVSLVCLFSWTSQSALVISWAVRPGKRPPPEGCVDSLSLR